jgi:hypothetical protein
MIIGHVGVALAAKRRWERVSLAALLLATFAPDILRVPFAAAGLHWTETNLYTHAWPWCVVLTACVGLVAWQVTKDRVATSVVVLLVLSHLALDMISGRKPLWAHGPIGLDVEELEPLELAMESMLVLWGWWLLRRRASGPAWTRRAIVPVALIALEAVYLVGSFGHRPYRTRCLASPVAECTGQSVLTTRWNTTPWW